jgi:hypothetical protein
MLIRAHTNVNAINEMGHSSLQLASMFKSPLNDKAKSRLPLVKLLVENGADIDHRDKGGFSAIDFAAMNQDLELTKYFLSRNARVTLEHQFFATKREHILTYVTDLAVFQAINDRLEFEKAQVLEEDRLREVERQRVLDEQRAIQAAFDLLRMKGRTKELRRLRLKEQDEARLAAKESAIRTTLDVQMESFLKPAIDNAEKFYHAGEWWKDNYNHWDIRLKVDIGNNAAFDKVYVDAKREILKLKVDNDYGLLEKRWQQAGGTQLKAVFKHNAAFECLYLEKDRRKSEEVDIVVLDKIDDSLDFEYQDQNDAELDGEDLDALVESAKSPVIGKKLLSSHIR